MSGNILFLLWAFIVPCFTVSHQFFKTMYRHKKQSFPEIILMTTFMAFICAAIGCGWGVLLFKRISDSFLLCCVLGNVVLSGVLLLFLGAQNFTSLLKMICFAIFSVFNLITICMELLANPFPKVILVLILLTYPITSMYQFLLSYINKENKK